MNTSVNVIDHTNTLINPETVAKLAKTGPVVFDFSSITAFEIARWRETFRNRRFLGLTKLDTGKIMVALYTGTLLDREDVYKALKARGDLIEVHANTEIRLPIGNFGAFTYLSRTTEIPEIRTFITLLGNIPTDPNRIIRDYPEWRPHITVGNRMVAVTLPKDVTKYQYLTVDDTTGMMICCVETGHYYGLINVDGTVRWGDINAPLTEKFIEDVYATWTTIRR